tara:strand:- start:5000 stop:5461 length:462 start_codon:yes stop_codon:yes gene_type:complete
MGGGGGGGAPNTGVDLNAGATEAVDQGTEHIKEEVIGGTFEDILDVVSDPAGTVQDVVIDNVVEPWVETMEAGADVIGEAADITTDFSESDNVETLVDEPPKTTLLTENDQRRGIENEDDIYSGVTGKKNRTETRSRIMANQTQGQSASLLTG